MSQLSALIAGNTLGRPMNRGAQAATLGGNTTLVLNATSTTNELQVLGEILVIEPAADRTLLMPPEAASDGMILTIINKAADATHEITIKSSSDGNLGSEATVELDQYEIAFCVCDGTNWYANILKAAT